MAGKPKQVGKDTDVKIMAYVGLRRLAFIERLMREEPRLYRSMSDVMKQALDNMEASYNQLR
jgi:Arc/MetJ-type ribon-helix-helix transcriptional regulator